MDYKILYTKSAANDINKLEELIAKRIVSKLDFFIQSGDPLSYAKRLKSLKKETYRFRVGNYRILFRLDKERNKLVILVVLRIVHRKSAYI